MELLGKLLLAGGVGYLLFKNVRDELKKEPSSRKEPKKEKLDMVSQLLISDSEKGIYFGLGAISPTEDTDSQLHVYQQDDKSIKLLFDIPEFGIAKGGPVLSDYIRTYNNWVEDMKDTILSTSPKIEKRLVGVINYNYIDNSGEKHSESKILDKSLYEDFAEKDLRRDGLTKFFFDVVCVAMPSKEFTEMAKNIYKPDSKEFSVENIYLAYELTLPIAGKSGFGCNVEILQELIRELAINFRAPKVGLETTTYGVVLYHRGDDLYKYLEVRDSEIVELSME